MFFLGPVRGKKNPNQPPFSLLPQIPGTADPPRKPLLVGRGRTLGW
jgi:hypothetical protein